jgi:hypothetical protein
MHTAGTLARRRYNPGAATGLLLYIPLAIAGFRDALATGDVSRAGVLEAFSLAVAYQAAPIVTLLLEDFLAKAPSSARPTQQVD